jgi:hypothetical protein
LPARLSPCVCLSITHEVSPVIRCVGDPDTSGIRFDTPSVRHDTDAPRSVAAPRSLDHPGAAPREQVSPMTPPGITHDTYVPAKGLVKGMIDTGSLYV